MTAGLPRPSRVDERSAKIARGGKSASRARCIANQRQMLVNLWDKAIPARLDRVPADSPCRKSRHGARWSCPQDGRAPDWISRTRCWRLLVRR